MRHLLEIDGVTLSYGMNEVLKSIFLRIESGEIIALLGLNGSGKSSLMKVVYGTQKAQEAFLRIDGVPIYSRKRAVNDMRYLPQNGFLIPFLTVNKIFKEFDVDLEEFVSLFPENNIYINHKVKYLPGGVIRLIETYLIIKADTNFVMLDEPFTQVMPIYVEKLQELIVQERLKGKKGFLISDHKYREVLNICDRIYLLREGTLHPLSIDMLSKYGYLPDVE